MPYVFICISSVLSDGGFCPPRSNPRPPYNPMDGRIVFTHEAYDDLGTVKRFKSHRDAKWFAEVNDVQIRSTGYKAPPPVDPYETALAECGECLL